jgi:MFS family permease
MSRQPSQNFGTQSKKRSHEDDYRFSLVLPVLFYEYLSLSITRSILPKMIVDYFGDRSYVAVGVIETFKGCLAFLSCPLFGKLSDRIGRKYCLLASVLGTTMPVVVMVFTDNMLIYAVVSRYYVIQATHMRAQSLQHLISI